MGAAPPDREDADRAARRQGRDYLRRGTRLPVVEHRPALGQTGHPHSMATPSSDARRPADSMAPVPAPRPPLSMSAVMPSPRRNGLPPHLPLPIALFVLRTQP